MSFGITGTGCTSVRRTEYGANSLLGMEPTICTGAPCGFSKVRGTKPVSSRRGLGLLVLAGVLRPVSLVRSAVDVAEISLVIDRLRRELLLRWAEVSPGISLSEALCRARVNSDACVLSLGLLGTEVLLKSGVILGLANFKSGGSSASALASSSAADSIFAAWWLHASTLDVALSCCGCLDILKSVLIGLSRKGLSAGRNRKVTAWDSCEYYGRQSGGVLARDRSGKWASCWTRRPRKRVSTRMLVIVQPSKQAAVALKVAWKFVPRDRYAISAETLYQVERDRLNCLRVVGGSGFEGRGPGRSGVALREGRGMCPGCFPIGWMMESQRRIKIKVRNAASGVSGCLV